MTRIEQLYDLYLHYPVICTDSRAVTEDCIFFALKGESFNGNAYAAGALSNGAALAVVDEPKVAVDERFFLVEDVLTALQEMAQLHRSHFKGPVLGITGTNGKTTTKELINAVLGEGYTTHATQGNLNNHIGVPLTILSADLAKTSMLIIEMGANHPGEIAFLCNIARPDFGLITNVGKAHLEGFGSIEGVIKTKTELYNFLKSTNGKAFVCSNQPVLMQHAKDLNHLSYGSATGDYCRGQIVSSDPFLVEKWFNEEAEQLIQTQLVGAYNADNVMAAVCVGKYFGVAAGKIVAAIEKYVPSNNRSQVLQSASNQLILDAYNANPSSMRVALENFALMNASSKAVILGDMFELGAESRSEHKAIVNLLKNYNFSQAILIGPRFSEVAGEAGLQSFGSTTEAYDWLVANPITNANILVKGSRGMKLEILLPALSI
ncbi:MAG: UDP-N-acetylmuramoyl-tripeptide--D-alanyl-D-alanine ligase [Bacteroidota bacterium]|nr:UDP-N-acetylmuramoyl-tripeptide--D-alanyl-D-alanine ligase [Bacteroidota bacterium]